MFVDHARIEVIAGDGGRGCVSFRREKYVPRGGPNGGDGGRGGNVVLRVDAHSRTLLDCRTRHRYRADRGGAGEGNNRTGRGAKDVIIPIPPGTVVRDTETGETLGDLVDDGATLIVAKGGRGGRGNARFATPTRQAPRYADPGEAGEERSIELELKLIADVGLVGKPNAGKSTMLSRITRARPRIGAYPFTTLAPNLGIAMLDAERQLVVADLPGLIEGAHEGKGLGLEFLRHVERTRVLALMVDVSAPDPAADRAQVEEELRRYSAALAGKPRCLVLSKADLLTEEDRAATRERPGFENAHIVSAPSGEGLEGLLEAIWKIVVEQTAEDTEGE